MVVHGMVGSFESTLFADEGLSIVPQSHTEGMFSWFPLFLPLCTPVRVQPGDVVTFQLWR
jgi:protein arginine N-methyltransferase 5